MEARSDRWLVAVGGGVASGKSTLARGVADALGAALLEADRTRAELMHVETEQATSAAFGAAAADAVYEEMIARAEPLLRAGRDVVLDGCFASRRQRDRARDVAGATGASFHLLRCEAAREVVMERLAERSRSASLPLDSWVRIYEAAEARREPTDDLPAPLWSRVPTDVGSERSLEAALEALADRGVPSRLSREPAA